MTHKTSTDGDYYVADVVVFETAPYADRDTFFVYEHNNHYVEYVWGLGYNAEGAIEDQRVDVEDGDNVIWNHGKIEFYRIFDNQKVEYIGSNYAANNIYAGVVDTDWDLEDVDYIQVNDTAAGYLYIMADAPIYKVMWDSDEQEYSVDTIDRDDVSSGDKMILFTDNDENVEYAISVDASVYDYDYDGNGLKDDILLSLYDTRARIVANYGLWNRIMDDAEPVPYDEMLDAAMLAAENALAMPESTVAERAAKLAALQAAWSELKDLSEDADAMASFTNTEKLALGAMMSDLNDAIVALGGIAEDEKNVAEAIANLIAASEGTDTEAMATAYLAYLAVEDQLTAEQKADPALALAVAKVEAAIKGLTKPVDTMTAFDDIEREYKKAAALTEDVIAAYDKVADPTGKTTPMADAVAAVMEQYDEAKADMALINALIDAHANYTLLPNGSTKAALLAAYEACAAEFGPTLNAVPQALLGADYSKYATAYAACQQLVAADDEAALRAKAKALIDAKAAYDADKSDANEDALLAALNNISDEENTAIKALSIPGYDYKACLDVFTNKAAGDRNAVKAALEAGITSTTDVTANSKASAIAAVKALAEEILAETKLTYGSDVTIVDVTYSEGAWTVGAAGSTALSAGTFTIEIGASYKGVEVVTTRSRVPDSDYGSYRLILSSINKHKDPQGPKPLGVSPFSFTGRRCSGSAGRLRSAGAYSPPPCGR